MKLEQIKLIKEVNIEAKFYYNETHKTWIKFSNWLIKTFGKDLHSDWEYTDVIDFDGKVKKVKFRCFNESKLSTKLIGFEVMTKIEKYVNRYCPEIKIVSCDDSIYSSSIIVLVPHPTHGITIIFIPQCTTIQNQFFLYKDHHKKLIDALQKMKYVYKN